MSQANQVIARSSVAVRLARGAARWTHWTSLVQNPSTKAGRNWQRSTRFVRVLNYVFNYGAEPLSASVNQSVNQSLNYGAEPLSRCTLEGTKLLFATLRPKL